MNNGMARKLVWTGAVVAIGLIIAWLSTSSGEPEQIAQSRQTKPTAATTTAVQVRTTDTPARSEQAIAPAPKKDELEAPQSFHFDVDGEKIEGLIWPSTGVRVPLLVLVPGPTDRAQHWQPLVSALAASRPMHIAAFDAQRLAQGGHESVDQRARKLARIDQVIEHVRSRVSRPTVIGLVGNDTGATAALLVSARRRDVRATVALSPLLRIGTRSLVEVLDILARRQVFAAAPVNDGRTTAAMNALSKLEHARLSRPSIRGPGLDNLTHDPGLVSDICGWLYATLGPVGR